MSIRNPFWNHLTCALAAWGLVAGIRAASVGPSGYTNDFSAWPAVADWATVGVPGGGGDVYDLDTDVNTNLFYTGAAISFQVASNNAALPIQLTNAAWSSAGGFVQTRPNSTRATVLLGKFVNNTGTNAAEIRIAYQLTLAGTAVTEDAGKGTHVYYSLSGQLGSWVPLAALHNTANSGTLVKSTNVAVNWPDGASLFLLWADDNTPPSPTPPTRSTTSPSRSPSRRSPPARCFRPPTAAPTFFTPPCRWRRRFIPARVA